MFYLQSELKITIDAWNTFSFHYDQNNDFLYQASIIDYISYVQKKKLYIHRYIAASSGKIHAINRLRNFREGFIKIEDVIYAVSYEEQV